MNTNKITNISRALSDENRVEIIKMLSDGEKCGCMLLEKLNISQPTLSHHMKVLIDCNLVVDKIKGKWHHYSLNKETISAYLKFMEGL